MKKDIAAVYGLIAEAESHAHGRPVDQIHFHEVGSLDALADVTGVCLLMEKLSPDQVIVSPIHVGSGHVHCAHGILPVPAPATAHILRDVPVYGGQVQGELCTPTGAALLKYFADRFGAMPVMTADRIGYGMGNREFETANCIRAFLGESGLKNQEEITELTCNIDDMTGEELGALYEILSEAGALDVSLLPAVMKKNRPGHLLLCVTAPEKADQVAEAILRHTSTLGVRRNQCSRYVLEREMETRRTKYGEIRCKHSYGYGADKRKPEWEDVLALSRKAGVAAAEVEKEFYRCEDRTAE